MSPDPRDAPGPVGRDCGLFGWLVFVAFIKPFFYFEFPREFGFGLRFLFWAFLVTNGC